MPAHAAADATERDYGPMAGLVRGGALSGLLAGFWTAGILVLFNPLFLDSFLDFLLLVVLVPLLGGLLGGLVLGLAAALTGRHSPSGLPFIFQSLLVIAACLVPGMLLGLGVPIGGRPVPSLLIWLLAALLAGILISWRLGRRAADGGRPARRRVRGLALLVLVSAAGLLLVWIVSAAFLAPPANFGDDSPDFLIIGVDGATQRIIDDLLAQGRMPFLEPVIERGTYGPLRTIDPMFSPTIWATISTGKMPDKHGVNDFLNASYQHIKSRTLWEILEAEGGGVVLYEWLSTWPPPILDGVVVPGWLARTPLTYPSSLDFVKKLKMAGKGEGGKRSVLRIGRDIVRAVRYGVRLSTLKRLVSLQLYRTLLRPAKEDTHYRKYLAATAMDADIFEYLLASVRPRYAFIYYQTIDPISHNYWKYYEPEDFPEVTEEEIRRYGDVLEETYVDNFAYVCRLLDRLGPKTRVIILSDHGLQSTVDAPDSDGLLVAIRSEPLLAMLGMEGRLEGFHTSSSLFLTPQTDDPEEVIPLLQEAADAVNSFRIPDVDMPLFHAEVVDKPGVEADYVRVTLNRELKEHFLARRITLEGTTVRHLGGECKVGDLIRQKSYSGTHYKDGIIIALGPGVRHGHRLALAESHVADVTPTALAWLGLPVARDMDGRVLFELFEPGALSVSDLRYVDTYGSGEEKLPVVGEAAGGEATGAGDEALRDQLKALGYMNE